MSSGKQNACSYRAGTKRRILHSHCDCQTPQQTLPPSQKPGCLLSFISLARAENFSPQIKEGIIANMADIPTVIHILCVHVCVWECDLCMKAMKKPIVVMQVCLISVYTTMSVVLWSPLVRLFAGLCCEPSGNAEGSAEICACPLYEGVIRDTHQRSCLSGRLTHNLSVSDASWFTAARPLGSRIGWRCCPVCQPGEWSSAWVFTFSPLLT